MSTPTVHYETVGSTSKHPALLFVHGIADDSSVWDETVAELSDDYICVTLDLPAHGNSPEADDPSSYERDAVLNALDTVLDDIGPTVFIGHSLGGYLGLVHHLTRPATLKGLVMVSTGPGFRDAEAMADWNSRIHANAKNMGIPADATALALHHDSLAIDQLTEVSIPIGLVVGSEDKNFRGANDYMASKLSAIDNSPLVGHMTIEGGRHRVMRTHPAEVADMIRQVARV